MSIEEIWERKLIYTNGKLVVDSKNFKNYNSFFIRIWFLEKFNNSKCTGDNTTCAFCKCQNT